MIHFKSNKRKYYFLLAQNNLFAKIQTYKEIEI